MFVPPVAPLVIHCLHCRDLPPRHIARDRYLLARVEFPRGHAKETGTGADGRSYVMGAYLDTPDTNKESRDAENDRLKCGVSSMRGWRQKQEASIHIVIVINSVT